MCRESVTTFYSYLRSGARNTIPNVCMKMCMRTRVDVQVHVHMYVHVHVHVPVAFFQSALYL